MLDSPLVRKIVKLGLEEDTFLGDPTSELTIDSELKAYAEIKAKEDFILCGAELLEIISEESNRRLDIKANYSDGDSISKGDVVFEINGKARDILILERLMLNFLQHLSGIATQTRSIVAQIKNLTLLDTRKTTPGNRILEKYAAKIGGARNQRSFLGDMILIKDNHIDSNRGVKETLDRVFKGKSYYMPVQIEVRNLDELEDALEYNLTSIMLDNMDIDKIKAAVEIIKARNENILIEVSGGITKDNINDYIKTGIDAVSSSAHIVASKWVDLSLSIKNI
ncbi:UNVERIFIED_CONTAM: hypothetical protein GTU68_050328 [Idotea baltica]|nr:hypothetical protein [Idotea baltica]